MKRRRMPVRLRASEPRASRRRRGGGFAACRGRRDKHRRREPGRRAPRVYKRRLLLSLVGRFGPLSKIEVARLTGCRLAQPAIMNRLQADRLLKREAPLRGRVGQPTIPMSVDPEAPYSFGLKIGRRSCDLVLIDFRVSHSAATPDPRIRLSPVMILDFVRSTLPTLSNSLAAAQKRRIAGLGVAAPFRLWSWEAEIGAPPGAMHAWRDDAEEEIAAVCRYPTTLCNDATAACAAFVFGRCWRYRDFLYFFIGEFLGGGLVLDGALRGRTGSAAALGSMPIMAKSEAASLQLITRRLHFSIGAPSRERRNRRLLDLGDAF